MIAAGQIAMLDEELSSAIVNLYDNVYTRLAANGEHYDYSLEREYFPAYSAMWDPARRSLVSGNRADRVRFRNTIRLMEEWSRYYGALLAESQAELRGVLAKINER